MSRWVTALIALTMIVAACGGSGGDDQVSDGQVSEEQASGEEEPADETEGDETDTPAAESTTDTADAAVPPIESPLDEIATDATPAGARPLLSWAGVDGAVLYRVVVVDADGAPYWAWSGSETQVSVGGVEDPALPGAIVFESMTWSVAALDADGVPLAISDAAPLDP